MIAAQSLPTPRFALLSGVLLAFVAGCAVHTQGLVKLDGDRVRLVEPTGRTRTLVLEGDAQPLAYLEDHIITVDGKAGPAGLKVADWSVGNGLHGLTTFVGRLERRGGLGLEDRNSGVWVRLHPDHDAQFSPWVGQTVLLEGYVAGPHQVKVQFHRILAPEDP